MDPHQLARVTGTTVDRYRAAARPFAEWLTEHGFGPAHATEWDDLLVEYKNDRFPKKSEFENLVAATQKATRST